MKRGFKTGEEIRKIEITSDTLTGRSAVIYSLSFYTHYDLVLGFCAMILPKL